MTTDGKAYALTAVAIVGVALSIAGYLLDAPVLGTLGSLVDVIAVLGLVLLVLRTRRQARDGQR